MTAMVLFQVSQALQIPTKDDSFPRDPSLGSLRRSNSSPSLLSAGSSDTLSPRESSSDTAQFGWLEQKAERLKQGYKSSDSDGGERSDDNLIDKVDTDKVVRSVVHPTASDGTKQVKFVTDLKEKEGNKTDTVQSMRKPEAIKLEGDISAKSKENIVSQKVVSEPKDIEHQTDGKTPEFHSMLSRQLSPSPASSEASSTQDEVSELPNVRRLRGHTISVVTPASKPSPTVPQSGSSTDTTRVGLPPSFVFLQLYHSVLSTGNEVALPVPNNEVKLLIVIS